MNKFGLGLASMLTISGVVYAQGLVRPESAPNAAPVFPNSQQGFSPMRGPGNVVSLVANEKFVFVVRGEVLYQYSVEGLKLVGKVDLPNVTGVRGERRGVDNVGRRDRNVEPASVD